MVVDPSAVEVQKGRFVEARNLTSSDSNIVAYCAGRSALSCFGTVKMTVSNFRGGKTCQLNQIVGALVDDGVGVIGISLAVRGAPSLGFLRILGASRPLGGHIL
jgi:hypothetical protein